MRKATWFLTGLMLLGMCVPAAWGIDKPVRGKRYPLTKQHGPYMIMVASFKAPPKERRTSEGLTPEQAADELVYELRQIGIPAYVFSRDEDLENIDTIDRLGRRRSMSYRSQQEQFCVLAGNYKSIDEESRSGKIAHATLDYIERKFEPKFLTDLDKDYMQSQQAYGKNVQVKKLASGGIVRLTPAKKRKNKKVLAGAFLTLNPMLDPEEVKNRTFDPLLLKLNTGDELSLLNNSGNYTLVVASFYGKATKAHVGATGLAKLREAAKKFQVSDALGQAAVDAWELANAIRQGNFVVDDDPSQPPKRQPMEAWVFHDKFRSVVTVGSFDSPNDPKIAQYQKLFQAKYKEHALTKRPFLTAETVTIPAILQEGQIPEKSWLCDPTPQLVAVPKPIR